MFVDIDLSEKMIYHMLIEEKQRNQIEEEDENNDVLNQMGFDRERH